MLPIHIEGMGVAQPERRVPSAELDERLGLPAGWVEAHQGVSERRWVSGDETATTLGAEAARRAMAAAAVEADDIDLILNVSGTMEQPIPDPGPLLQRALGWGRSGVPAFTVHATCLSFLVGFDVAASLLAAGRYRRILLISSDVASVGLDFRSPETSSLFGDAAAAAVVRRPGPDETGALHAFRLETYGEGAHHTQIPGGGTRLHPNRPEAVPEDHLFQMSGLAVMKLTRRLAPAFLERMVPGLTTDLSDVDWVVPHQASRLGLQVLPHLGVPADKVVRTLDQHGNCVAASLPLTLHAAIADGRLQRGQKVLMLGTGAGLSLGAALFTY